MGFAATLIVILTFIANLAIAFVAYHNNPKSWTNRLLSLLALILASWTITNFLALSPGSEEVRLFWVRVVMFITAPMGATTYLLAVVFPKENILLQKRTLALILFVVSSIALLSFSPWMFQSLENLPSGSFNLSPGPAIVLFAINHLGFTMLGLVILIKKFLKSQGKLKQQLAWFLTGTILTLTLITLTNFIAVVFFDSIQYTFIGPTFTLFQVGFTAYAIVRHRLLEVRILVLRTISFTLLFSIITVVYAIILLSIPAFLPEGYRNFISIVFALILASTFSPLRSFLENLTEKIFHKKGYSSEGLLEKLGSIISSTLSLNKLCREVIDELQKNLHISRAAFILLNKDGSELIIKSKNYDSEPSISISDYEALFAKSSSGLLLIEDLEEGFIKDLMRKNEISVVIPLVVEKQQHGLLILGEKLSGDIFTRQDLELLEIFGPQISVAVQNSLAYDEIRRFNITLKEEIAAATKRLRKANKELRHLDKLKDEFVFIATHELKNPVTAMRGYLYMIKSDMYGKVPKKMQEAIDQIDSSNQQLVQLVNDLLQIARAEAKTIKIKTKEVDACESADSVIKNLKPLADQKNLEIVHKCEQKDKVMADPNRLKEILNNLISNAIKYSDKGTITVSHSVSEKRKNNIVISVADQGDGISKKDQKKLFTRFFRAEEEQAKGVPGTGLGLFIVKQLVEKMNGKIWFESKLGEGSTFYFSLPKV